MIEPKIQQHSQPYKTTQESNQQLNSQNGPTSTVMFAAAENRFSNLEGSKKFEPE
jgi:hypothetical protein